MWMEGGVDFVLFFLGMVVIGIILFVLLWKGDYIVLSSFLFGNMCSLFDFFWVYGIEVIFVDVMLVNVVECVVKINICLVFVEIIVNFWI